MEVVSGAYISIDAYKVSVFFCKFSALNAHINGHCNFVGNGSALNYKIGEEIKGRCYLHLREIDITQMLLWMNLFNEPYKLLGFLPNIPTLC